MHRDGLGQTHRAVVGVEGVLAVVGRDHEQLRAVVAGTHDLLLDPADRPDLALLVDGPGAGHRVAAGQ
jgi:hypothetical protein